MVNRTLLSQKLAELADRIERVREHSRSAVEFRKDRDAFEIVAFNLLLAVQVCADIASHIIADEKWAPAGTLGDSFTRLEEQGVIPAEVANSLRRAVGLRNIVAHGYAGVDHEMIEVAAISGISDLSRFAQAVASWASEIGRSHLKNRSEPPEAREDDAGIQRYFEEDDRRIGGRNRFMR